MCTPFSIAGKKTARLLPKEENRNSADLEQGDNVVYDESGSLVSVVAAENFKEAEGEGKCKESDTSKEKKDIDSVIEPPEAVYMTKIAEYKHGVHKTPKAAKSEVLGLSDEEKAAELVKKKSEEQLKWEQERTQKWRLQELQKLVSKQQMTHPQMIREDLGLLRQENSTLEIKLAALGRWNSVG